ncbi:MAG: hypothetical protein HQK49_12075 [Oligoflexia bacterium]|nr:hypothetical protein [Oligoflexia bacterium]
MLGYNTVLEAMDVEEADYFVSREKRKVDLLISEYNYSCSDISSTISTSSTEKDELDSSILRLLSCRSNLDLTPLLLINTDHSLWYSLKNLIKRSKNKSSDFLSRMDNVLTLPFGLIQLKSAVLAAYQRRQSCRKFLVLITKSKNDDFNLLVNSNTHWEKIILASSVEELPSLTEEYGYKIGAIVLDPVTFENPDWSTFVKFRKSPLGSTIPSVCLSRDPLIIDILRTHCDLFFEIDTTSEHIVGNKENNKEHWYNIQKALSLRLLKNLEFQMELSKGIEFIKKGKKGSASKVLRKLDRIDSNRWERHQFAGDLYHMNKHPGAEVLYFRALAGNPCTPHAYLKLCQCISATEKRKKILDLATLYCPHHPQLKQLKESL